MDSVKNYIYDPVAERFITESGAADNTRPVVAWMDFQNWSLKLRTAAADRTADPYAIPAEAVTFTLAIDTDKRSTTTPLVRTDSAQINLNAERDTLTFTIDAATEEAKAKLDGVTGSVSGFFELCGRDANGRRVFRISFAVDLRGAVDPTGMNPPTPGGTATPDLPADAPDGTYMRQIVNGVRSWVKGALSVAWDAITGKPEAFCPNGIGKYQDGDFIDASKSNFFFLSGGPYTYGDVTAGAPQAVILYASDHCSISLFGVSLSLQTGYFYRLYSQGQNYVFETIGDQSIAWDDVTGKPAEFPPSSHLHAISQVSGLQASLDGKAPKPSAVTPEGQALAWNGSTLVNRPVQGGGGGIEDAPGDGKAYVRKNGAWVEAFNPANYQGPILLKHDGGCVVLSASVAEGVKFGYNGAGYLLNYCAACCSVEMSNYPGSTFLRACASAFYLGNTQASFNASGTVVDIRAVGNGWASTCLLMNPPDTSCGYPGTFAVKDNMATSTVAASLNGSPWGGGAVDLSNYSGPVNIKDKDGRNILSCCSDGKLYIGGHDVPLSMCGSSVEVNAFAPSGLCSTLSMTAPSSNCGVQTYGCFIVDSYGGTVAATLNGSPWSGGGSTDLSNYQGDINIRNAAGESILYAKNGINRVMSCIFEVEPMLYAPYGAEIGRCADHFKVASMAPFACIAYQSNAPAIAREALSPEFAAAATGTVQSPWATK